ncbi:MAG TPA: hypothetical protein VFK44_10725 [Bacillales bacterium]|nr:hypothetical protein [Bacillales bacterium]
MARRSDKTMKVGNAEAKQCCKQENGVGMADTFQHVRNDMGEVGAIYRNIRATYGESVSIVLLDPRNHFSIAAYLLKHWRRRKIGTTSLLRSLLFALRRKAVFYNGSWLNPDGVTNAEIIVERMESMRNEGEDGNEKT